MWRLFFSSLACLFCFTLSAQDNFTDAGPMHWAEGGIILKSGDSLKCNLRYNHTLPGGGLQVLDGENTHTLTEQDLKAFYFFDARKKRTRNFYSLSIPENSSPNREYFVECIYQNDKISIISHRTVGLSNENTTFHPFKRESLVNNKYLLNKPSGKLLPLSKENAWQVLVDHKTEVEAYIQTNRIKFKKTADYVKVFEYHNSL